jgi:hypothetical protein
MNNTNTPTHIDRSGVSEPSDVEIIDLFATAGLTVSVVDTCADAACPSCHGVAVAWAA